MKIIILLLIIIYSYANENNNTKENLGIPYPLEREIKTYQIVKDTILNYGDALDSIQKAYSKPLNTDFEYLKEFEKNIKEK